MIETPLRPLYQKLLVDPLAKRIINRITPNQITLLACLLGVLIIPALLLQQKILGCALLLLSGYCDTLDGSLARLKPQSAQIGSFLDIMADRLVEFSAIFALFALDPMHRSWGAIVMLGSILMCITSFLVSGIFTPNNSPKGFHYSSGLMERAEAFIFFILMMLLPHYFNWLAAIFSILVLWTAYVRTREFVDQFNEVATKEQSALAEQFANENISTGI